MLAIPVGPDLVRIIKLAYQADRPILLEGRHGVGKSEILNQAGDELEIEVITRDLSLMEPPDLVGIPRISDDGRTHYAPPAFLPDSGRGLFVLEEVNRSERYMQTPCLQLLTTRRLNDYHLPDGWLPCAAINSQADGYQVDELDPALLSRFMRIRVEPDVGSWVSWARSRHIHAKIIEFVEKSPEVFKDPNANPRAWASSSRILEAWELNGREPNLLAGALAGLLDSKWALAFIRFYTDGRQPLSAREIVNSYPSYRGVLRGWVQQGRLDLVAASVELLKKYIQPHTTYRAVWADETQRGSMMAFMADLPADLRKRLLKWLEERGFSGIPF